jgi:hypothetical protein
VTLTSRKSVCRSYEGTGIGLSLTKELVALHGGTLSVESQTPEDAPGAHGSTFVVRIPLGKEHLPAAHIDGGAPSRELLTRPYGQGVIEEAGRWLRTGEQRTPSDASTSEWDAQSGSTPSNASLDSSTLFFVKSDRILLGGSDFGRYAGPG